MKRIWILTIMLFSIVSISAKTKIVDSSAKSAPVWYGGAEEEFIITSSMSDISIEDAKRRAVEQIKVKMIESVAQNINYSSFSSIEQKSGDEDSFSDEFKSALLLNSANIPFISGISESKIDEFYWAITEDTSTKKRDYIYTLKYPFPHSQIKDYIAQFERVDKERAQELEMLEVGYRSVASVEEISDAISKCGELDVYFFDATRKAAVSSVMAKYTSLYGRISAVTQSEELGSAYIVLQVGDNKISTTRQPTARYDKEVIQNLNIVPQDGGFVINYDPTFCETRIPYVIELSFPVGSRRVTHKVTFTKSDKASVNIQPQGVITLTAQDVKATTIANIQIDMTLSVAGLEFNTPIVVDVITLKVPQLEDELYCNKVSSKYVAADRVSAIGVNSTTISKSSDKSDSTIKILSGEVSGYYGEDKTPFQSKFTRSYKCNW